MSDENPNSITPNTSVAPELTTDLTDSFAMSEESLKQSVIKQRRWFTWWKALVIVILLLILIPATIAGILYLKVAPSATTAYQSMKSLQVHTEEMKVAAKSKDLTQMQDKLNLIKSDLDAYNSAVNQLSWVQKIPYATPYYNDAVQIGQGGLAFHEAGVKGIDAVKPYSDLLGLSINGQPAKDETAKDRIDFVVTTLDKIKPQLLDIGESINKADQAFSQIDSTRYPDEVQGVKIKEQLAMVQNLTHQAKVLLKDSSPIIDTAPYLLGVDKPRTYLVLFQNDAELRPTGGFLTAYTLMKVDKGKFQPILSSDIYDLDSRYSGKDPAPQALIDFIADPYAKEKIEGKTPIWRLRDRNLSPDFKVSMEDFMRGYEKTGAAQFDGIIAVDTKFLLSLLEVIGPVGVPGYGNFGTEKEPKCNCPQVIYELESAISYETPYIRENRKAILGPLTHSVLANAMGQPKEKMAQLVETGFKAMQQKNVLVYFPDEHVQAAMENLNAAGRVGETDGDYLMVVDTNLGGRKSQLYIEQEIGLEVQPSATGTTNKLTIRYKNPQADDQWLNGESPDWLRVYVPQGSTLTSMNGAELEPKTSEDLGKTVFSNFFVVRPKGAVKIELTYQTPIKSSNNYNILVQKQGGAKNHKFSIKVAAQTQEFPLDGDKKLQFNL